MRRLGLVRAWRKGQARRCEQNTGAFRKASRIDGSRVEEMVLAGQIEEVAQYCESDVPNTYHACLVYELFRGSITAQELDWSEAQIRDFVAKRKTANSHLSASLGTANATETGELM